MVLDSNVEQGSLQSSIIERIPDTISMYVSVPGFIMFQLKSLGVEVFSYFSSHEKKSKISGNVLR